MEKSEGGIFDEFFDGDEESDRLFSVDQAVIIRKGEVHHRADFHLISDGDGALLDGVETEDGGLGRVEDRGGENGAVDPAIGNGEDTSEKVGQREFAFACTSCDGREGFFQTCEVELIAIPKNGNHETLLGANGNTDIEIVL